MELASSVRPVLPALVMCNRHINKIPRYGASELLWVCFICALMFTKAVLAEVGVYAMI